MLDSTILETTKNFLKFLNGSLKNDISEKYPEIFTGRYVQPISNQNGGK